MLKIGPFLVVAASFAALPFGANAQAQEFKFGILRETSGGEYRMQVETTRIPQRLKETGFRFGLEFSNPKQEHLQWFEVVYLPEPLTEASGNTRKVAPRAIQTDRYSSSDARVVDHFWFDPGDPAGQHRLELYVNGQLRYSVDFDVVTEE